MTQKVYSVDEDASLAEIAELLERRHIKRVPVLRNGKLVGIVSRANLLHGLASTIIEHHEPGAAKDAPREAVLAPADVNQIDDGRKKAGHWR